MEIPEQTDPIEKPKKKGGKKEQSFERLRVALEKLQLARAKINVTFIALGFTAYRYFYARIDAGKQPLLDFPNGRHIGILLIFAGFMILLLSTLQHIRSIAKLKAQYADMHYSVSLILSCFLLLLSLFLFVTVIFRL